MESCYSCLIPLELESRSYSIYSTFKSWGVVGIRRGGIEYPFLEQIIAVLPTF